MTKKQKERKKGKGGVVEKRRGKGKGAGRPKDKGNFLICKLNVWLAMFISAVDYPSQDPYRCSVPTYKNYARGSSVNCCV